MRKPKIACFRYKRYNDVYVSNVSFSTDVLLSLLDVFLDQKIIVLIESDTNYVQTLSSIGKNIGITGVNSDSHASRFTATCNKTGLLGLLNCVNVGDFDGMFIANINNNIITDDLTRFLDRTANSMVKDGISDISLSIDFSENQMVVSFLKEKYEEMSIKDRICSIFG